MRGEDLAGAPVLRTFVAVEVGEEVAERAAAVLERLRQVAGGEFKWVDPRNFHLTIKFLGPTRRADLPRLSEALRAVTASAGPFALAFAGVGAFPSLRRPQVLWLGVSAGEERLAALAGEAENACESLGWPREPKPFRAHLTLARSREPRRNARTAIPVTAAHERAEQIDRWGSALEAERAVAAGATTVRRLLLMESQLSARGPTYTLLEAFPFQKEIERG